MQQTIRMTVFGKVQGVFYRKSTKEQASAMGITGTVRNLPNDTVEIIATGERSQLNELLQWCKKDPDRAVVTDVQMEELPLQRFKGFEVG